MYARYFFIGYLFALVVFLFSLQAFAESVIQSEAVKTVVGNPTEESISASGFSCPLRGKRTIGCGSFMSDPKFNRNACAGPNPEDRGHMGRSYVKGAYAGKEATLLKRRAHSIDVDAPAGETVYLPTIEGKTLRWDFVADYTVSGADGGGTGYVFTATSGSDKWVLHFVHMNPSRTPPPAERGYYQSADPVTTVAATGYTHLHINIGKNPESDNGGRGWFNPEDLGMCVN